MNALQNYSYLTDTIELKKTIEVSFLTLGERLSKIRHEKLWSDGYTSFEEFLEEAKLSPATASKLINIYQRFFIEWKFPQEKLVEAGGWTVVATLLPVCKTREQAEDWLGRSHLLTRSDMEKEIKELKTGLPMKDCLHTNSYVIRVCRDCGNRERIYEEDTA